MPIYNYQCKCGHVFDEFHTSFSASQAAEKAGITCPKCQNKAQRNHDPNHSMKGGAFRRYGLYTYH